MRANCVYCTLLSVPCCRALNNANWQWLSCSRFFHQYFRCYSPVAFGKKTDPGGLYIKKWLPALQHMPTKYIYEPWLAPLSVQRESGCVIGTDYPRPIVDHAEASKGNMNRMKAAYSKGASLDEELIVDGSGQHELAVVDQKRKQPTNKNNSDIRKYIKK